MEQSILKSTKKILGVSPDDDSFDLDIITHINSAFSTINDLGVGPATGFVIEDDQPVWADFLADDIIKLSKVKTCVFLKTRLAFDPPATTFHLNALNEQIREHEWRLSTNREDEDWTDPDPTPEIVADDPFEGVLPQNFDGGGA